MNLNLSTFDDLIRENSALQIENTYLQNRVNTLEIEKASLISENSSLVEKFNEYMYLHPKRVGVKSGKAYEIKQSITENQNCNNPNESLHNKRKPGDRPGHKGHSRKKPEYISRTEIVEDVPIPKPIVTEYTIHRRYCRCCRKLVEEPILSALPNAKLGLNVMLIVVWLKIGMRLTEEAIPMILEQLCRIRISEGEVSNICTMIAKEFGDSKELAEIYGYEGEFIHNGRKELFGLMSFIEKCPEVLNQK